MAKALTEMLAPDEQILFRFSKPIRSGCFVHPILPLWAGAIIGCGILLAALTIFPSSVLQPLWDEFVDLSWGEFASFIWSNSTTWGALGVIAFLVIKEIPDLWRHYETVLTNQRLLYRPGSWQRQVEELAVDDIESVAWSAVNAPDVIDFVARDGMTIELPQVAGAERVASEIAALRRLTAPMPVGAMPASNGIRFAFSSLASFALLGLAIWLSIAVRATYSPEWNSIPSSLGGFTAAVGLLAGGLGAAWLAFVAGDIVGDLAGMAVMKNRVEADEMRNWICVRRRRSNWRTRLYLRWASSLYGRPLHNSTG